jgi:hypothetical protein
MGRPAARAIDALGLLTIAAYGSWFYGFGVLVQDMSVDLGVGVGALVLLGRRPAHRRRVESAMLVLTAAATVLTQYFGWTRVSYPVMAAGLVLAVVVAGVVLLVGSQDGETTPDEPTPA